jgi:hypothetical protein
MVLPSIILFFEYLITTSKIKSVIFTEKDLEIFYKTGLSTRLTYGEIESIKLFKAAGNDNGSFTINANENYYFARIIAKDNTTFVLTSLLGPDLSEGLALMKDVPVDRKKTGYAFISFRK